MLSLNMLLNMPAPVESPDPILDVLAADPAAVIGRRYAGYCLFLFGAADEDLATWFARNLVALDSLTGTNIACLVLAARVKVRVERDSLEERRRRLARLDQAVPRELDVSDIRATSSISRMVSKGVPLWNGTTREITAVTYGTDAFASRLGLTHVLPCLVVLDAFPSDSYEILRLTDANVSGLVPLLREVMQKFNGRENLTFFEHLANVERTQSRINSLQDQIAKAEGNLTAFRFKDPSIGVSRHREEVRRSLVEGNTPEFVRLLQSSLVNPGERIDGGSAAVRCWSRLRRNSKTLNNRIHPVNPSGG